MSMYLCYVDESGTSDIPGSTSHFVLSGLAIPIEQWKICDKEIEGIKGKYALRNVEIHVGWILRSYLEQTKIKNFEKLKYERRRSEVEQLRKAELLRLQKTKNSRQYRQTKKNYAKTSSYTHLTYTERYDFIKEMATCVSQWGFARLFAECIDKIYFDPTRRAQTQSVDEQSFEQIVTRYEYFLKNVSSNKDEQSFGLLIHDNNETVAKKHTSLMKDFYLKGTMWTKVSNIIETPFFVDSELTSMIQIADLCAYSIRRYLENNEEELFDLIVQRADKKEDILVGIRHYTEKKCSCKICSQHKDKTLRLFA